MRRSEGRREIFLSTPISISILRFSRTGFFFSSFAKAYGGDGIDVINASTAVTWIRASNIHRVLRRPFSGSSDEVSSQITTVGQRTKSNINSSNIHLRISSRQVIGFSPLWTFSNFCDSSIEIIYNIYFFSLILLHVFFLIPCCFFPSPWPRTG